jgi:transposase
LTKIPLRGKSSAHEQRRARILDQLHHGEPPKRIAEVLKVGIAILDNIQKRYSEEVFAAALKNKSRSGRPPVITGEQKAKLTALASTDAPEGHARWTLRLLADKPVEQKFIDRISHNEVGKTLEKPARPAPEKAVAHGECALALSFAVRRKTSRYFSG